MNLEALLESWDGESLIVRNDRPSGAWIFIAVHSTRLGPAVGGTDSATVGDLVERRPAPGQTRQILLVWSRPSPADVRLAGYGTSAKK